MKGAYCKFFLFFYFIFRQEEKSKNINIMTMFRECGGRLVRGEKLKKHLTVNRRDINNFKELITSKFQFCGRKEKSYGLALWHVHKFGTRKLTRKLTRKAYSKIQHPFGTSAKRNPNRCLYVFWGDWNSSCGCVTVHLSLSMLVCCMWGVSSPVGCHLALRWGREGGSYCLFSWNSDTR